MQHLFAIGFGTQELIIILIVILILFGGTKIPQLMRGIGKGVGELQKGLEEGKQAMSKSIEEAKEKKDQVGVDSPPATDSTK